MQKNVLNWVLAAGLLAGLSTGCETLGNGKRTGEGAGIGAVGGALVGGLWGAARGDWQKGALIGAAAGATVGGVTGMVMDKQAEDLRKAGISAQRDEAGNMIISMSGDSLKFASGKAVISPEGAQALNNLAGVLKKYPENRINFYGHTDSTGSASLNRILSQQRSDAVKAYLQQQGVASRCLLGSVGYGPDRPVGDNRSAEGRALNRRVELSVTVDQDEAKTNEAAREKWANRNQPQ